MDLYSKSAILSHQLMGGGRPIILLHGLLGSSRNLGVLGKALSDNFQVCLVDLPNHGQSYREDQMGFASMARAVKKVAEENGWSRFSLLGHSLGGKVAMRVALDYPDAVESLLVEDIAPVDYPAHHAEIIAAMQAIDLDALSSRKEAEQQLDLEFIDQLTRGFLLQNLRRNKDGYYWMTDLPRLSSCYPSLCKAPLESGGTTQFEGPVLFVGGERSNYIQRAHWASVETLFPNAKFRQIRGAGHVIHAEKPAVFASMVRKFFFETMG